MFSVRLQIENLGPIKTADLEIGDITVIFGPPNTGKSYTLKALYASTLMLDEVAREYELQRIIDEAARRPMYPSLIDAVQVLSILAILYKIKLNLTPDDVKTLRESFEKITGVEANWHIKDNNIFVTLKSSKNIDLSKIIITKMDTFWNTLPLKYDTKIRIRGLLPTPKIPEIISESLKQPYTFERQFRDKQGISLELSILLKLEPKGAVKVTTEITLSCDMESPVLERSLEKVKVKRLEKLLALKDFQTIIKNFIEDPYLRDFYTYLKFFITRKFEISEPMNMIIKKFIEESIGKSLEIAYSESFGLQAVRFIPFGRSPIICQLEYLSKEPFLRTKDFMQTFYGSDILLYSYISWLSKGRAKVAEKMYDKGLISLFTPVLQGKLTYDKMQGLVYRRLRSDVPIKWASALAGEVTGILLPILTAPLNSGIIIEEPESQLHYSAQVLMTFALAGLSNEYDHKLIFSTHSDLFALILAYIKESKPNKEEIKKLAREILKMQKIRVEKSLLEPLAESASKAKDLNIKFYYYEPTREGVKVLEKSANEIIRSVPSLTDVIDKFASWALSLRGDKLAQDYSRVQRE